MHLALLDWRMNFYPSVLRISPVKKGENPMENYQFYCKSVPFSLRLSVTKSPISPSLSPSVSISPLLPISPSPFLTIPQFLSPLVSLSPHLPFSPSPLPHFSPSLRPLVSPSPHLPISPSPLPHFSPSLSPSVYHSTAFLLTGIVIHLQPPPPRESSDPSIVTTYLL